MMFLQSFYKGTTTLGRGGPEKSLHVAIRRTVGLALGFQIFYEVRPKFFGGQEFFFSRHHEVPRCRVPWDAFPTFQSSRPTAECGNFLQEFLFFGVHHAGILEARTRSSRATIASSHVKGLATPYFTPAPMQAARPVIATPVQRPRWSE